MGEKPGCRVTKKCYLAAPTTRSASCLPGIHHSGRSRAGSARLSSRSARSGSTATLSRSRLRKSTRSSTLRALSLSTGSTLADTNSEKIKIIRNNSRKLLLCTDNKQLKPKIHMPSIILSALFCQISIF